MKLKSYKIIDGGLWIPKEEIRRLYDKYTKDEDAGIKKDSEAGINGISADTRAAAKARHIFQAMLELI